MMLMAVIFLPCIAAVLQLFIGPRFVKVTTAAMLCAWLLQFGIGDGASFTWAFNWRLGFRADDLTTTMIFIVTTISLLVHIYSLGYMKSHSRISRYFSYLSFFTFAMLGLVTSDNFLFLFIFWELMGLCSYLLIGFYFEAPAARRAAMKAFLVTRIGDVALLVAIAIIYGTSGSFSFHKVLWPDTTLQLFCSLLILLGAMGKSAQFPLHFWLPDAMEGPSPVSALIHAATMVAAGIYLVGRSISMEIFPPDALMVTAAIGTFTALYGAFYAVDSNDMKKVLAYSTISQLGFMLAALGMGNSEAAFTHLTAHATFKALLFLGSGIVLHALNTRDMREMGGLRHEMPITYIAMFAGALALSGIPPFAGFFSKEEILLTASRFSLLVYIPLLLTTGLTAFYIFRMILLIFHGERRPVDLHHVARIMEIPCVILAILSIAVTFHIPDLGVMTTTLIISISGIAIAFFRHGRGRLISSERIGDPFKKGYDEIGLGLLQSAASMDLFDRRVIDRIVNATAPALRLISTAVKSIDQRGVDYVVNGVAQLTSDGGQIMRRFQTGRVQDYALLAMAAVLLLAFLVSR